MDDITRGPFSYDHRETAPPWSGGWLATSTISAELPPSETCSGLGLGEPTTADQQKKKLFVGMAPKSAYEEDYRVVFATFGTLSDIYVIRDRNGLSKGCAFVKYESVQSANDAIESLHDKYIMPGGFRTLVVTIADDRRGPHAATAGCNGSSSEAAGGSGACPHLLSRPPANGDGVGGGSNGTPNAARGPITTSNRSFTAPLQQLQQAGCLPPPPAAAASASVVSGMPSGMPYLFCSGNPPQGTYVYYPYIPASSSQLSSGPTASAVGGAASKRHHTFALGSVPGGGNRFDALAGSGCVPSAASPKLSHQVTPRGLPEGASYVGAGEGVTRDFGTIGPEEKGRRWAKQSVGPAGANLFVYYLPGSLSDADLATAFAPFGEVLSAKVYYDRDTGESKGFGFVSYSKSEQADAAITGMNGFFIGQKRLKVVRKRGQQQPGDRCYESSIGTGTSSNKNSSPAGSVDGGYVGGGSMCGTVRSDSGGGGVSGGGAMNGVGGDGVSGLGNGGGGSGPLRTIYRREPQLDLDFLTPEGLLGQSMTRQTMSAREGLVSGKASIQRINKKCVL